MASSNIVNYSVRQNKAIERAVVFDGLKRLVRATGRDDYVFVGFGSVWFVDFEMAHRDLGIETMVSIESDELTYKRAGFNKPYRTIELHEGLSHDVIPELLRDSKDLASRPWILWLDYDRALDSTKLDEIRSLVQTLPDDSILLTTFNARAQLYGKPAIRLKYLEVLFDDAFDDSLLPTKEEAKEDDLVAASLSSSTLMAMQATFAQSRRSGSFVPAFNLTYQDGALMATAGGVLTSPTSTPKVREVVADAAWPGLSGRPIITPPLTAKEVAALRSLMPAPKITLAEVIGLGFELLPEQIDSFTAHYLHYPNFVQTGR